MADLLVLMEDITVENPGEPGAWLPGMVVDVFPDGQLGPGTDQHPRFFIVRIPGVSEEDVRDLIEDVTDWTDPNNPVPVKRRRWSINWSTLSTPIKRTIERDREIEVSEALFRSYISRFD